MKKEKMEKVISVPKWKVRWLEDGTASAWNEPMARYPFLIRQMQKTSREDSQSGGRDHTLESDEGGQNSASGIPREWGLFFIAVAVQLKMFWQNMQGWNAPT